MARTFIDSPGLFPSVPPRPEGWETRIHTGPAVVQGAISKDLLDGGRPPPPDRPKIEVIDPLPGISSVTCDVVVIGSGAGGAAAAETLAAAGSSVVVLEEGSLFTREDFIGSPIERFLRMSKAGGTTAAIGRAVIPIPIGKTVGGTTTINSGTCFRAPRKVLDEWASEGLEAVGYSSMSSYMERVEAAIGVSQVPWELLGPNGWIADKGASALGLTGGPMLRNVSTCHGTGQCAFGCPTDAKQAMHLSYLPSAIERGAQVFHRQRAEWLEMESGRVVGVISSCLDAAGRPIGQLRTRARVVVISCGAIGTPLFLMKNRVGRTSDQLGKNLRIHPAVGLAGWFKDAVKGWKGTLQQYYIDELFDTNDVMIESTNAVPSIAFGSFPGFGSETKRLMADSAKMASIGLLVSDTSSGRVRRLPSGDPLITYAMNDHDRANLMEGLGLVARILLSAGADRVATGLPGLEDVYDESGCERLRHGRWPDGSLKLSAYHPMGTARMGVDPATSVVDLNHRVHDHRNLFIADASVFPSCLGVNPQVSIMAFATRAAEAIAATL